MPKEDGLKMAPDLERLLHENTAIIGDCLGIGNEILLHLTADDFTPSEDIKQTCIMSELISQNNSLLHLKEILATIRAQMMGGNQ